VLANKQWMLGSEEDGRLGLPVSTEWEAVFALVGRLTSIEVDVLDVFRRRIWQGDSMAERAGRIRVVENFTEIINVENAVAAGCVNCPICDEVFVNKDCAGLEPPLKTICNHIIGKQCLQE
jgi:hypothetical protein